MERHALRGLLIAVAFAIAIPASLAAGAARPSDGWRPPSLLPASFRLVAVGPAGGTIWMGRIPNHVVPTDDRLSAVYLPPNASAAARYPVIYLLHGMSGSPSSYVDGMRLAQTADDLIARGETRPFIAVIPVGGPTTHRDRGEWAGPWESYVVDDAVPWTDAHLPTIAARAARAIAGLSAGGYGAIDIGLRHPSLFSTLESWGGYFRPFRDGPFIDASSSVLAAHTPALLVREEARRLREEGTRFYLSTGPSHGDVTWQATVAFAREVSDLGLSCRLYLVHPDAAHIWRDQLGPGLLAANGAAVGGSCDTSIASARP